MLTNNYFTIGEFSKICGTTKETLFHYDEIGILKPAYVDNNKYRYYTPKQYYDFDLIVTLKASGCSLLQIKEYMENYTPESYLQLLKLNQEKLKKERQKIMHMERVLKNAQLLTKYAMETPCGVPKLEEHEKEYFIVTKLNKSNPLSEIDEIYELSNHFDYCLQHNIAIDFPLGSVVLKETLLSDENYDSYYFSKISKPIQSERLFIKPQGTYLTMLHKGDFHAISNSYKFMLEYIHKNNLMLVGNAYCYDVLSYYATNNIKEFMIHISMEVVSNET
jgi:DNA-binding transcriptional MerR regulator